MKKLKFPKISEKMKRRFLAGACAVMMIFVSVMAYLTSTERTTNRFTIGDIKIDLVEPSFPGNADPDNILTNKRTLQAYTWQYHNGTNWTNADEPNGYTELANDTTYVTPDGYQIKSTPPTGDNFTNATVKGFRVVNGSEQWYVLESGDTYSLYNANGESIDSTDNIEDNALHLYAIADLAPVPDDTATGFTYNGTNNVTFYKRTAGEGNGKDISYADANYILPGELIPKDPKIVNTGKNEAVVFMKVEVPTYTDVTGVTREVFAFSSDSGISNGDYTANPQLTKFSELTANQVINENWIYLGKAGSNAQLADVNGTDNDHKQDNAHTYIFGYKTILNPEAPDDHIKDSVRYKDESTHDASVIPYQTEELFKYVVLNPELNGVDPYEGNKFYQVTTDSTSGQITKAEPVLQDIKIHAYGVQAQFLKDNSDEITTGNNMDKDTLTKIWTVAGFGSIVNDTIPQADGHNKYGIPADPRDENYTNPKNPWTNANGTPISLGKKSVLTREITYTVGSDSRTYKYYKVDGSTNNWVGAWYPYEHNIEWTDFTGSESDNAFQTYLNNLSDNAATVTGNGGTPNFANDNIAATYKTVIFEGATTLSFVNIGNTGWKCITTDSAGTVLDRIPEGTWKYNGSGSYTTINDILTALGNGSLGSEGTVTLTKS